MVLSGYLEEYSYYALATRLFKGRTIPVAIDVALVIVLFGVAHGIMIMIPKCVLGHQYDFGSVVRFAPFLLSDGPPMDAGGLGSVGRMGGFPA